MIICLWQRPSFRRSLSEICLCVCLCVCEFLSTYPQGTYTYTGGLCSLLTMKALVLCVLLALSCAQESSGSDALHATDAALCVSALSQMLSSNA